MNGKQLLSMKCVLCVQQTLNYFHCFCTSTIKIVPVQTILYQFKLFCTSSIYSVPVQKQIVPKCKLNYNIYMYSVVVDAIGWLALEAFMSLAWKTVKQ